MSNQGRKRKSIGLIEATGIGVGAIVGGGVLALGGVAFSAAGPGAMAAFALNGVIAILTALSFAEMSTAFPESGGTYTFAKKVLSVQTAFTVGWVVWFASIVASVLYALGFATYAIALLAPLWRVFLGSPPSWLLGGKIVTWLAVGSVAFYGINLFRKSGGGGQWETMGKLIVFAILILGGFWAFLHLEPGVAKANMVPFFPEGSMGLFKAMGYTFIALQGFDLIAAVAGEVESPAKTLPRAMLLSLGVGLAVYLPLLFFTVSVGVGPGESIAAVSSQNPETIIALTAQRYMGPVGYWLVVVAAVLSMLSALQANMMAASRVARAMARDRTLPQALGTLHDRRGTPVGGILASSFAISLILLIIPSVAVAGAASSLIFLLSFALVHLTCVLARRRGGVRHEFFRTPFFPLIPAVGGAACLALAIFQAVSVPSAGLVVGGWFVAGGGFYIFLLAGRARVFDASSQAEDPHLVRLRGKRPLVLVPIANPESAESLVMLAHSLAPPEVGRVLLLSVVGAPDDWKPGECPQQLTDAQTILRESLITSFSAGLSPEALITVAPQPWPEIMRVSKEYNCESLALGFSKLTKKVVGSQLEKTISSIDCDVVILRAPHHWRLVGVRRVLVPVAGRGSQYELRARLLGNLQRSGAREITFLLILPEETSREEYERSWRELARIVHDEASRPQVIVLRNNDVAGEIIARSTEADLLILGLQRINRRQKAFGALALKIAEETTCPLIMISRGG